MPATRARGAAAIVDAAAAPPSRKVRRVGIFQKTGWVQAYFLRGSSFTFENTAVSSVVATCDDTPKPTYAGFLIRTYSIGPSAFSSPPGLPAYIVKLLPSRTRRRRAGPSRLMRVV